jgi:endonuclease YncB( thermonuclease family)
MQPRYLLQALLLGLLLCRFAYATEISGRVFHIADGDTITVLDSGNEQHKIRLAGIDAPESKQPFGNASKRNLSAMVAGKIVVVDFVKFDRYQRMVGKVVIGQTDVCLEQVKAGLAWHYKKYEREQSLEDRQAYATAGDQARAKKRGLRQDRNPVPPWEWRKR